MSNIYTLKHSLKPGFEPVLTLIARVAKQTGTAFFVAGATARDLILFNVFGREPGRQTRDIDTGIFISDWAAFADVKDALIRAGLSETPNVYRLRHESSGLPIDIIPFGAIADNRGDIQWPPEHVVTMSVAGFQEAYHSALSVEINPTTVIKVASLAGLSLLKLVAWQERGAQTNKDAADFLTILLEYQHPQMDRLWDQYIPAAQLDYDLERQAAFLLGYDLNGILSLPNVDGHTIQQLKDIESTQERLLLNMLASSNAYNGDRIAVLLQDFWSGLNLVSL